MSPSQPIRELECRTMLKNQLDQVYVKSHDNAKYVGHHRPYEGIIEKFRVPIVPPAPDCSFQYRRRVIFVKRPSKDDRQKSVTRITSSRGTEFEEECEGLKDLGHGFILGCRV